MQGSREIQPSQSPWASPVFLVRKRTEVIAFASIEALNSLTNPDTYPLPRIDDLLGRIGRNQVLFRHLTWRQGSSPESAAPVTRDWSYAETK